MKNCKDCNTMFDTSTLPKSALSRARCVDCFKIKRYEEGKAYREKAGVVLKEKKKQYYLNGGEEKVCKECRKTYNKAHKDMKFCSRICFFLDSKKAGLVKVTQHIVMELEQSANHMEMDTYMQLKNTETIF